ncbi:ABC transporter ATP-binding protein [Stackebrandtia nassauensis]|uniref:ABC transporter related protein n=1 Tax=Stackebrandtia nassauensis (strain DSM 44728 / CIP 108903 / NRRL B-16338 / NBRC 102104 / LLR-40K-21) TaxID=446470 RepID=D3QAW3_STANL|nr:ABC transporter ATP-binding protein [Stackebrandtia nassauensis]ADD44759.1 ABC transporter related protein [Stackebrandtia nassauensis DSM 44728]
MRNSDVDGVALEITELDYAIGNRRLFSGLELSVAIGETLAVLGPSGSGKSTLLSCVLGLLRPDRGSVRVAGTEITKLGSRGLAKTRAESIGMVFQFGELLPELSPVENVALAAMLARKASADIYQRAQALLDELGVPEAKTSASLSGGERQRTAVARALINSPVLLLADEPTGALDAEARDKTAGMLFDVPKRHSCGMLLVTHDLAVAARADRVVSIVDGALETVSIKEAVS